MTMIERIAKALTEAANATGDVYTTTMGNTAMDGDIDFNRLAQAALECLLEPDKDMVAAGVAAIEEATDYSRDSHQEYLTTDAHDYAVPGFKAMIRAAMIGGA